MASRRQGVAVPPPQRGGVAPVGKAKNVAVADGKSRRAPLGDIGNQVTVRVNERKPEVQINRPITRSFGAQLLANAQTAAAANNKKPVAIKPADAAVGRGGRKPAKKDIIKKEENIDNEVIVISSDAKEKSKPEAAACGVSSRKHSRKKVCTLTSVLTARSKVACGLTEKPAELPYDIDAADKGDQLAVVDYVEDIYKFYKSAENSCRIPDYMDSQVEINAKMRAILSDWLIEVHHKFELSRETLYLTVYIVDRYLSMESVLRKEFQLVGVASMLIASKYEEIWAPEVVDFIHISDKAYNREQILLMEKSILNKLEWNLTVPTPYVFLVRFVKAALCDAKEQHMVFFFAELALMQYSMLEKCPSMVAAAAVYAARCTLKKCPLWTETLKCHTGYSEPQLWDCTEILVNAHKMAPEGKLKVICKKFSSDEFAGVSLHPPATALLEELKASRK